MIDDLKEPVGNTEFHAWCRKAVRYMRSLKVVSAPNAVIKRTTEGTLIIPKTGAGGGTSGTVEVFTLTTMHGDYYDCAPVSGGAAVKIAKPSKLRNSVVTETIDGNAVTYAYSAYTGGLTSVAAQYVRRDATVSGVTEKQDIIPRYLPGDTIYAMRVSGGSGVSSADYIDLNVDGRAWAVRSDQST